MPQCCSVPFCSEKKGGHKFPTDETRLKQWLEAIRRNDFKPTKHSRVCKKHFNPEDYTAPVESYADTPRYLLSKNAVPSKFVWNEENHDKLKVKKKCKKRSYNRQEKKIVKEITPKFNNNEEPILSEKEPSIKIEIEIDISSYLTQQ